MFAMLSKHGGNVSAAARELGIARKMQICDPET